MSTKQKTRTFALFCMEEGETPHRELTKAQVNWLGENRFNGQKGRLLALPDEKGAIGAFAFGMGHKNHRVPLILGTASANLPAGNYRLAGSFGEVQRAALAFKLGAYRFPDHKEGRDEVVLQSEEALGEVNALAQAAFIARDLINRPANDLGPDAFEKEIRTFAKKRKMECKVISGDDLLKENLPMIHTVGRASSEAPRLIDLSWGEKSAPKVTLVGKGVTFDTGGLNIKTATGMVLMKKDMGGAANILGLAHAIVAAGLKLRLRILLPVVENAISGNAFRPGDILSSRAGLSVEIGNTDAEGRLILADALSLACEDKPELLIDMATLTGAARVALGPDLPPIYATSNALARELVELGMHWGDPLWHMPLWCPYDAHLSSRIADVNHISAGGFAGSITAALFLQRFVKDVGDWVHVDIFGWAPEAIPGRARGGTDQGIRAAYFMLKNRFG